MNGLVIGIDVQAARGCPFAVLDSGTSRIVQTGWMSTAELAGNVHTLSKAYKDAVFAIDAPRMPLSAYRTWEWSKNNGWRHTNGKRGRHCEVVLKALGLANPQWTPLAADAPEWMQFGFQIFQALKKCNSQALEVFPSASYRMLNEANDLQVNIPLSGFLNGPKDMLDAIVAALTGAEFLAGRGEEVGGGDDLGTIVLPRKVLLSRTGALKWPK